MSLHIGSTVPDFTAETTHGTLSFHDWIGEEWVLFCSHPKDFTPVCTTELGTLGGLKEELAARNAKAIVISVDTVEDHHAWSKDIAATQGHEVNFPIIGDPERTVANLYDMVPPEAANTLTVRSVFFIDPHKKIRAMLTYPASTGRNFHELLRVLDSLQLTDKHSVATPANWVHGEDVVVAPSIATADIPERFPKGHTVVLDYLRTTPHPGE